MAPEARYAIVLHAGAAESWIGDVASKERNERLLQKLVCEATDALARGMTAVDVATDTVAALEDHPEFNAGVVDGKTSEYRAVAGLQHVKNPVRLARALLPENTPAFLFGETAEALAAKRGLEMVEISHFTTSKRKQYWDSHVKIARSLAEDHGTVGAVVLDLHGNLAAANSTGGMTFKLKGRIGDTAVLGAGIWADDRLAIAW
ncbi:N-terminal nucleophile aminohydrolase [Colletotrichum somersetense]|nr:N-terminal nucleophile aminohydrolase [Colletotrichum somersetense]